MVENPSFRKRAALVLAGLTLVASGCSVDTKIPTASAEQSENPTPTPTALIDNIVNCQIGPFKGKASYDLRKGEIKDIGGITTTGEEEDIVIFSMGNADIHPYVSFDITLDSQTELIFHSNNFKYEITQGLGTDSGSKGDVFMECVNSMPTT